MKENYINSELTSKIIEIFYIVYNKLGYGFIEKVYEKSMLIELRKHGLDYLNQESINVYYDNELVGDFYADIIVEKKVILELKAVKEILPVHEVQLVNYLKATEIEVGLILNFGPTPKVIRKIFTY